MTEIILTASAAAGAWYFVTRKALQWLRRDFDRLEARLLRLEERINEQPQKPITGHQ